MLEVTKVYNIDHPLIDSMYLKKENSPWPRKRGKNVLVIDAKPFSPQASKQERQALFSSFLADLDLIKNKVQEKSGKFSRIDIRYY